MRYRPSLRYLVLLASLAAASSACSDDDKSEPTDSDDPACVAGEAEPCTSDEGCPGTRVCVDGGWGACELPAELCDGADNDCDGAIDEDFVGLGDACSTGEGQCATSGVNVCSDDQLSITCSATAGPAGVEVCDDVDNDCDGTIDNVEGAGELCAVGTGICEATGAWTCDTDAGSLICDATPGDPQTETCNGLDDDCDGTVDNVDGIGEGCVVGTGACQRAGTLVCDPVAGGLVCDAVPGAPEAETCNDIDDDCDGLVDNVPDLGATCTVGTGACERAGSQICDLDSQSVVCSASPGSPTTESCNGTDDDCDGFVDNLAEVGEACVVGAGACEASGLRVCDVDLGALVCDAIPNSPETETCNDVDDDCDGDVDNVIGLDQSCTVGIGACQSTGNLVCDLGSESLVCDAIPDVPQTEVCNGIDDDCDESIDNVPGVGDTCVVGVGSCERTGSRVCDPDAQDLVCSVSPGSPQTETCNGLDDDCDGIPDNVTLSFAAAQTYGADAGCAAMALGDINGDGHVDIVCAPHFVDQLDPETRLFTYLGEGDDTFGAPSYADPVAASPHRAQNKIGLADVDGDGHLDVVATGETMKVQVYINDGHGTFATPYEAFDFEAPAWHGSDGLLLEDIDGDGDVDVIATVGTFGQPNWDLAISLNDGYGNFSDPTFVGTFAARALAILSRDLDGDDDRDLIVVTAGGEVAIVRATGPGAYAAPTVVLSDVPGPGPEPLLVDLDGDGYEDLLLPASGERILLPGTATGFAPANSIVVPVSEASAAAGQLDCDGSPEVVILAYNGGAPLYYLETPIDLTSVGVVAGQHGFIVRLVDVDLDGKDDVVIGSLDNGVRVLLRD